RGVESNSDPRRLPLPGTTTTPSSGDPSRRGGDQVSATVPADAREALDMVRAGLGYLAAATQADVLRELEQHDAMATAARAGFLAAFTAGQGSAGDGTTAPCPG